MLKYIYKVDIRKEEHDSFLEHEKRFPWIYRESPLLSFRMMTRRLQVSLGRGSSLLKICKNILFLAQRAFSTSLFLRYSHHWWYLIFNDIYITALNKAFWSLLFSLSMCVHMTYNSCPTFKSSIHSNQLPSL